MIRIKRAYDPPERFDGRRILVDRLWPRGVTKGAMAIDAWLKDVTPSTELRKWFGHRTERWDEFRQRYERELNAKIDAWTPNLESSSKGVVTLLYGAHDVEHNNAIVLRDYLARKGERRARVR